ncbi:MAG TPA: acyltransferase [Thiothrix sp.]|nr:acyltransferase [Thiothrix sp.]
MPLDHLTFTRFLAALSVVIFHYGATTAPFDSSPTNAVFQAGPIAVSYFYALSGFIMAIAYYQLANSSRKSNQQQQPIKIGKYWLARFARIYPVYLLALLLVFFANFQENRQAITALFLNISLLQAWFSGYPLSLNSPGWSLSVEAFFYFCLPFLILFAYRFGKQSLLLVTIIIWIATQGLHTFLLNSPSYQAHNALHDFIYYHPLMHINTFLLGLMVGIYFKENYTLLRTNEISNRILLFLLVILIASLLMLQPHFPQLFGINIDFTNGLLAPLSLLFIVILARDDSGFAQILAHPWLVLLGEASYSLYILQRPAYGIYEKLIATPLAIPEFLSFYVYLLFLITLSIASFKLFETPARQLIRSWGNRYF